MGATINIPNIQLLETFSPLNLLSQAQREEVLGQVEIIYAEKDETLFKKGDLERRLLYLISGEVGLYVDEDVVDIVRPHTERQAQPLDSHSKRLYTARANEASFLACVDIDLLNSFQIPPSLDGYDNRDAVEDDEFAWLRRFLESTAFLRLPATSIQLIISRLKQAKVSTDEVVISQGDDAERYYIVKNGHYKVVHHPEDGRESVTLANLKPGDGFGEDAVVSYGKRGADVIALEEGDLMYLSREDFIQFLANPILATTNYEEALDLARRGAVLIDCRSPAEHQTNGLADSVNIPLLDVRSAVTDLDPSKDYIVYCNDGKTSSAAAFILSQRGFYARLIANGIGDIAELKPGKTTADYAKDAQKRALIELLEKAEESTRQAQAFEAAKNQATEQLEQLENEADELKHEMNQLKAAKSEDEQRLNQLAEASRVAEQKSKQLDTAKKIIEVKLGQLEEIRKQEEKEAEESRRRQEEEIARAKQQASEAEIRATKSEEDKRALEQELDALRARRDNDEKTLEEMRKQQEEELSKVREEAAQSIEKAKLEATKELLLKQLKTAEKKQEQDLRQKRAEEVERLKRKVSEAKQRQQAEEKRKRELAAQCSKLEQEQSEQKPVREEIDKKLEEAKKLKAPSPAVTQSTPASTDAAAAEPAQSPRKSSFISDPGFWGDVDGADGGASGSEAETANVTDQPVTASAATSTHAPPRTPDDKWVFDSSFLDDTVRDYVPEEAPANTPLSATPPEGTADSVQTHSRAERVNDTASRRPPAREAKTSHAEENERKVPETPPTSQPSPVHVGSESEDNVSYKESPLSEKTRQSAQVKDVFRDKTPAVAVAPVAEVIDAQHTERKPRKKSPLGKVIVISAIVVGAAAGAYFGPTPESDIVQGFIGGKAMLAEQPIDETVNSKGGDEQKRVVTTQPPKSEVSAVKKQKVEVVRKSVDKKSVTAPTPKVAVTKEKPPVVVTEAKPASDPIAPLPSDNTEGSFETDLTENEESSTLLLPSPTIESGVASEEPELFADDTLASEASIIDTTPLDESIVEEVAFEPNGTVVEATDSDTDLPTENVFLPEEGSAPIDEEPVSQTGDLFSD